MRVTVVKRPGIYFASAPGYSLKADRRHVAAFVHDKTTLVFDQVNTSPFLTKLCPGIANPFSGLLQRGTITVCLVVR